MPSPGGRGGGSAPPPGRRGRGRGRASYTFELPISRRNQVKALNSRRGRARKSRSGRSGPGSSEVWAQSPQCQDHVAEQTPLSGSSKLLGTLKESSTTSLSTPHVVLRDTTEILASSGCSPTILIRKPPDWYFTIYIRIDRLNYVHTYPDVGGPFKSLQEAENAIDSYLRRRQVGKMCKDSLDKLSPMDWLIQRSLYWPDGRRRKWSEAFASQNTLTEMGHLLQALVDKYNEDHNLIGDLGYELKDVLHYQTMCKCKTNVWYYHFNFTAKTKGADGIEKLFFAEVKHMEENEIVISCFCMINTDANGPCDGCANNGNVGMKHPSNAKTYNAGHKGGYLRFERSGEWDSSDDDDDVKQAKQVKADEDRLRFIYKGLDNPDCLKEIFTYPNATAAFIEE